MRCPICKQSIVRQGNPFRPFCSERCQRIDLDNWLEGRYRVPAPLAAEEEEAVQDRSGETESERE